MISYDLVVRRVADKGYVIKLNDAWNRYMALAERAEIEIPRSFISRRSTFKDKLLLRLGNMMDCVQPLEKSPDLFQEIFALAWSTENAGSLITSLKSPRVKEVLDEFVSKRSEENVNFKFWWNYIEMVSILLMFTRAQRERGYGTCTCTVSATCCHIFSDMTI